MPLLNESLWNNSIPYGWFKGYLRNRQQFTTVNNKQSELLSIDFGVPQGSILGPLLFLIYIHDLSKVIMFSSVHHFADYINILYVNSSLKDIKRKINHDLSNLVQWLRANKMSLNVSKTEIVISKSYSKQITKHLDFHLSGQKIRPKNYTNYLGIIIDEDLTFREYVIQLRQKLNRINGLLAKLRHQVSSNLLKTIYFALSDSGVWGQGSNNVVDMIKRTQNKARRIISFKDNRSFRSLYANHRILKLQKSLHCTIACLFMINFVITYQMVSQIILNFLKIRQTQQKGFQSFHLKCTKSKQ